MGWTSRRAPGSGVLAPAALAALLLASACGTPGPSPVASTAVTAIAEDGIRTDLDLLANGQSSSRAHRALGTTGYDAAVGAVEDVLREAGWVVSEDEFTAQEFVDLGGSSVVVGGRSFGGDDVRPLVYAPGGTAEGPVVAIGWEPGSPSPGGQGCESTDYGTLPAHAIVVVGPDDCYRRQAVIAAQSAGAEAYVAVYPSRPGGSALRSTLISPSGLRIPAIGVSSDVAEALRAAAATGATATIDSRARSGPTTSRSVIAEMPGTSRDKVVMLGAHLDSVIDGPGINDNGTGVAALLGLARALAATRSTATIRLAFWGAEEEGLLGSTHYVRGLDPSGLAAIVAYLNADEIGSPNGYAGVYDEAGAPAGSTSITTLLEAAVGVLGGTPVRVDIGGGSDHTPFAGAGVPVGGVFAGASEPLTDAEAASFGGTVGQPADTCYHQACDGADNVNLRLARLLTAALADVTLHLAANPELVAR